MVRLKGKKSHFKATLLGYFNSTMVRLKEAVVEEKEKDSAISIPLWFG